MANRAAAGGESRLGGRLRRERTPNRVERLLSPRRVGPSGLCHVGSAATALAAEDFSASTDQPHRIETRGQIVRHADDNRRLAVIARYHGDDPGADASLQIVGQ
jgi:hypothetical protein